MKDLFAVKTLESIQQDAKRPEYQLRRALGPLQLTLLGIGGIIGAGIFATIGTAAAGDALRPGAGPGLILSFVLTSIVCGFVAVCYAEFAAMVPIAGSAYTYSYATLGELAAWIIGWDLIIEYAVGNIAVAISWANYFKTLLRGFGIHVPDWLSMDYRTAAKIVDSGGVQTVFREAPHLFGVPIVFNLLAAAIVAFITIILVRGIRESARFNAVMVGIKILVLLFFIGIGAYWVKPENWTPFAPNGWAGISAGAAIVFFAYIGFDAVSTAAEETRNPQRNMPIGIIASLVICTVLYVVVAAVFTGMIPYQALKAKLVSEQAEPLTMALAYVDPHLGWAVGIVAFGSVIAHTAVLLVFQLGQPRIFFSMSRDGLLPPVFQKVHPRFRTPHVSTILTGLFVGGFAAIASLDEMVDLTNIGTLFAFILVCVGIIILRIKEPARKRSFRVPGGWPWAIILYAAFAAGVLLFPIPVWLKILFLSGGAAIFILAHNHIIPTLGMLSCLYLIYYLPPTSWLRFGAWLNLGFLIYGLYGSRSSRLTGLSTAKDAASHTIKSAYNGAWLGVFGSAVVFITHLLDGLHLGAGIGKWLFTNSWWLSLPLFLNAFVFCPALLWRIKRARRQTPSPAQKQRAASALRILLLLAAAILVYLACLIFL